MLIGFLGYTFHRNIYELYSYFSWGFKIAIFYCLITCCFVKHKTIKTGFLVFAFIGFVVGVLTYLGTYRNQNKAFNWFNKHTSELNTIAFLATLYLFIHVYRTARKQNAKPEPVRLRTAPFNFNQD